jgi:hypothetical protein
MHPEMGIWEDNPVGQFGHSYSLSPRLPRVTFSSAVRAGSCRNRIRSRFEDRRLKESWQPRCEGWAYVAAERTGCEFLREKRGYDTCFRRACPTGYLDECSGG